MSVNLIPFEELPRVAAEDYVVFGGTFDPPHSGHVSVVRRLSEKFSKIIIAPTVQNPWKAESPSPLEVRISMLELIFGAEQIDFSLDLLTPGIVISSHAYTFADELVRLFREKLGGGLWWAVAEDGKDSVAGWRNWLSLKVPTVVLNIEIDIHSAAIRAAEEPPHPALATFIKEKGLYRGHESY